MKAQLLEMHAEKEAQLEELQAQEPELLLADLD